MTPLPTNARSSLTTSLSAAGPLSPEIFDMGVPCVAAFDKEKFDRDGYWVWDGIMTDACRDALTASLKRCVRAPGVSSRGLL